MSIIIPSNSIVSGGYAVDNSCRFDGSSASMKITPGSNMNLLLITWSGWIKRSGLGTVQSIFAADNTTGSTGTLYFDANDKLNFQNVSGNADKGLKITTRVFRDPSAWYNIILAWDSANSTAADRIKIYVNGVRETSFSSSTNPDVNEPSQLGESGVATLIGTYVGEGSRFWNGYMAEVVLIDGAALAADQFGEFDSDSNIWKPIDVSGLTFGTHGFYLDFEASGNLGNDANGGTDLTETNLAAIDQVTDTPTNNFCTMNPLDNYYAAINVFGDGNCHVETHAANSNRTRATVGLTTGKWYVEVDVTRANNLNYQTFGWTKSPSTGTENWFGESIGDVCYYGSGKIFNNGSNTSHGASNTTGDIMGCFIDLDNNTVNFSKNGTMQNSGTGYDISSITGQTDEWFFACGDANSHATVAILETNFGNPNIALASGNTDVNGYGNFEYSPSVTTNGAAKDYLAICTKNLSEVLG
jgi:hypothetical protein